MVDYDVHLIALQLHTLSYRRHRADMVMAFDILKRQRQFNTLVKHPFITVWQVSQGS